jgi:hypothetical protein
MQSFSTSVYKHVGVNTWRLYATERNLKFAIGDPRHADPGETKGRQFF